MTRTGKIFLAKNIKLDKNYKSVLNYNEDQMISLMSETANLVYFANNYTFIRERGSIQVNAPYSQCVQANYMAFQNPDYSGKYFFAFIDEIRYLSPNASEIIYTIDVWTTWFSYWTAKACLVLREHVIDDTVGANTVPESIELGEYIINAHLRDSNLRAVKIVLASTVSPSDPNLTTIGGIYNGIYSGFQYYTYDVANVTSLIQSMANNNKIDALQTLFLAPDFVIPQTGGGPVTQTTSAQTYDLGVSPITTLNGYTPVNKKLLTYPFCYIEASNGNGANAIYHQELFSATNKDGEYVFRVFGALTQGCSIRCIPINYKGSEVNTDEGINLGKYPICNWASDQYTNWITQNGVNIATNLIGSTMEIGTGKTASGLTGIVNSMDQIRRAHMIPPQSAGNLNCGDVMTSIQENTFHFYRMTIKSEFAQRIDQYFTRLGYRVNLVKIPNMANRTNYNYVQVAQEENVAYPNNYNNICLPAKALDQINSLFRNGVTIWNNHANFGDYSVTNTNTYTPPTP